MRKTCPKCGGYPANCTDAGECVWYEAAWYLYNPSSDGPGTIERIEGFAGALRKAHGDGFARKPARSVATELMAR